MSISELPAPKVSYTTAKDVCDDIWAGALDYAQDAGYHSHPLVMTMLWSGLLLTTKTDLEKYGIFQDVQQNFVRSLSEIYNVGLDQVELLADIKGRMLKFYEIISEELGSLDTEPAVITFLQIVEETNVSSCGEQSRSISEKCKLFQTVQKLLSIHIFDLVHNVDSPMIRKFRSARSQPVKPKPAPAAVTSTPAHSSSTSNKSSETSEIIFKVACIAIVCLLIAILVAVAAGNQTDMPSAEPTRQTTSVKPSTATKPTPLIIPASGKILSGMEYKNGSTITVTADSTSNYVVTLKDASDVKYVSFFVRAGETVTVGVPSMKLYVYFASGKQWYGYGRGLMFGENTVYSKDDDIMDFINYSWEYTLYPVSDGNFSETPSDEDEFF